MRTQDLPQASDRPKRGDTAVVLERFCQRSSPSASNLISAEPKHGRAWRLCEHVQCSAVIAVRISQGTVTIAQQALGWRPAAMIANAFTRRETERRPTSAL